MHRQQPSPEGGFTLVEVIVAMVVFMIVSTGFLFVLTSSLATNRDTRARIVAANLAAETIDLARSAGSVFSVTHDAYSRSTTVNGDTFHIDVQTSWQTTSGATATCEAGAVSGSLAYKNISVTVTWDNPRGGAVHSDTSLTPRTKINDQTLGTVLVGVIDAAGMGVSGATVSLDPAGVAPVTTDSDGCAYLLRVPVGTYSVEVSKSGFVNDQQISPAKGTAVVTAGATSRVSVAYDDATRFTVSYPGTGTVKLPTNLTTTFISSYGAFQPASTSFIASPAAKKTFSLFPFSSGYSVVAGSYADAAGVAPDPMTGCLAADPGQWIADETHIGLRPGAVAGTAGGTAAASAGMGVVTLSGLSGSGNYLKAVYVGGATGNADTGDPGCIDGIVGAADRVDGTEAAKNSYIFGNIISSNKATIALPYGTWKLYRGNGSALTSMTTQITSGIAVTAPNTNTGGTIVLDPRVAP